MEIAFKIIVGVTITCMMFSIVEMHSINKINHEKAADKHQELKNKVEEFIVEHIPVKGHK